jgi:hypothetical protein
MYKAEARNLEMEHTVKNLQNRIEMLESRKTLQGDGGNFHSIHKKDKVVLLFFAIAVQVDVVLSALFYDLQYWV